MTDRPLATDHIDACPACGSDAHEPWLDGCHERLRDGRPQRYSYRHCAACDAYFLHERPKPAELGELYFEGYAPYTAGPVGRAGGGRRVLRRGAALGASLAGAALERLAAATVAEAVERFHRGAPGTFVDYGCGRAEGLDRAAAHGWETIGVDFDADVLAPVAAAGHRTVLTGNFDAAVPDHSVDRMLMSHVVEHLPDPRAVLSMLRRKLAPGGSIHIATPDPSSLGAQRFGRRWFSLDCPRHFVLLPPATLTRLLEGAGFGDVEIHHELVAKDLLRSWGYTRVDRGRMTTPEVLALPANPDAMRFARPIAAVAWLRGRSDRYHAFARV